MPATIPDTLFSALRTRFQKHTEPVLEAVSRRSTTKLTSLTKLIGDRQRQELDEMTQILDDLARNLEVELNAEEPRQMALFTEDERTQLRKDRVALEARLARIPEEKERERQAIEDRYSGLVEHSFPVAVVFVVPESLATRRTA